jgi:calcium/proton exchanger cax
MITESETPSSDPNHVGEHAYDRASTFRPYLTAFLVLALGARFFIGGTRFSEQGFNIGTSEINSTMLVIAIIAILLPTAFDSAVATGEDGNPGRMITKPDPDYQLEILHMSHGMAIILLLSTISN